MTSILNNRYQLQREIGAGGMAEVYYAMDLMLERPVAIKLLRKDFSGDEEFRARFHQEAKAAANLSHPNLVTVHDFGLSNDQLFIVMEYVEGLDLNALIMQRGRFSIQETLALLIQACAGVGYAHRAGLVHCDLKPHNILVTHDQRVKVADFGIARALATIPTEEQSPVVWGSPQYFSPEQAAGGPPSPASDVYSLGVILFEMLTGQLPFNAATPDALADLHRVAAPPSARSLNPLIFPDLERLIEKVLSKEPANRYRNADQLGRVLQSMWDQMNTYQEHVSIQQTQPGENGEVQTIPNPPAGLSEQANPFNIDWLTVGLGLLTVLAVGGLIPFWLYVWFAFNPTIP